MEKLMQKIESILSEVDNSINEKISGTIFLEKLKYSILDNFNSFDQSIFKTISSDLQTEKSNSIKSEFKNRLLKYSLSYYKDSISKIKSAYSIDTLTILIDGFKTISIFELNTTKKSALITIRKNMGIVLSKNTVTAENISSGSIILDINLENSSLDIEN